MAIAVDIQFPALTAEQYDQMIAHLGPSLAQAPGFLAHSGVPLDGGGWRIAELWQTEEAWGRFVQEQVAPMAKAAGMAVPAPRIEKLHRLLTPIPGTDGAPVSVGPVGVNEGEVIRLGPIEILVKESGRGTRHALSVAEFRGKGFRIPPHTHTEHDETIYVLEGDLGVMLGERTFVASAGTSFTIPVNVPHSVWNESDKPVRFLNNIAPARYLEYFRELVMAWTATGPNLPEVKRVMGRYGLRPVV